MLITRKKKELKLTVKTSTKKEKEKRLKLQKQYIKLVQLGYFTVQLNHSPISALYLSYFLWKKSCYNLIELLQHLWFTKAKK